jgi:hypothetical protein
MIGNKFLKPCDVAICFAIATHHTTSFAALGKLVGISTGQAFNGSRRLKIAGLLSDDVRSVAVEKLIRFCVHGLPVAFAPTSGPTVLGIPTGLSAPPFEGRVEGTHNAVWPDGTGAVVGESLLPLYPGAVRTPQRSTAVYELLTIVDVLRTGQARDRRVAEELLVARLGL